MSTILYHGEPSGPSLTVLAALAESGVEVECRPINLLAGERHTLPDIADSVALDMGVEGEGAESADGVDGGLEEGSAVADGGGAEAGVGGCGGGEDGEGT